MNGTTVRKIPLTSTLLSKNREFCERYKRNALMQLINSPVMKKKVAREALLDAIQVFSNYFQKVVMLRYTFCDDSQLLPIVTQHLVEEFGHNISLSKDRHGKPPIWDPILEATASWFSWKMFTLDNDQKSILVHLVLESSANIFFKAAHSVMTKYNRTEYFSQHAEVDEEHEKMGYELIKNLPSQKKDELFLIQQQGWDMLNAVCERIANLTFQSVSVGQSSKVALN